MSDYNWCFSSTTPSVKSINFTHINKYIHAWDARVSICVCLCLNSPTVNSKYSIIQNQCTLQIIAGNPCPLIQHIQPISIPLKQVQNFFLKRGKNLHIIHIRYIVYTFHKTDTGKRKAKINSFSVGRTEMGYRHHHRDRVSGRRISSVRPATDNRHSIAALFGSRCFFLPGVSRMEYLIALFYEYVDVVEEAEA